MWVKTPALTREKFLKLYDQGPDATFNFVSSLLTAISSMQDQINTLVVEVEQLKERNKTLEARLNQDSHNSSLPPSSDKFKQHSSTKQGKSNRSSGGQKGHNGITLKRSAHPDITLIHSVDACGHCGDSLKDVAAVDRESRQVVDIPPMKVIVTDHVAETKICPHCKAITHAHFPDGVTKAVQYGRNLKGVAVYLMQHQLLPSLRTVEAIYDLFNIHVAEGTLFNWLNAMYETLDKPVEAIKKFLIEAEVLHADETGINCNTPQGFWLHIACTAEATYCFAHQSRGMEAVNAIGILPMVQGRIIHDFWPAYMNYGASHGFCNAHIVRELTLAFEEYKQSWAFTLKNLLFDAQNLIQRRRLQGKVALDERTIHQYEKRYDELVKKGLRKNPKQRSSPHKRGRVAQSKPRNLLDRLHNYREYVLAFLYDFAVPFTNNQAERDFRMVKVKLKISGCFRSPAGALVYSRIHSYISTARKNGLTAFEAIINAFNGQPFVLTRLAR